MRGKLAVMGLMLGLAALARGSEYRDTQEGFVLAPPSFAQPTEGSTVVRLAVSGPAEDGFSPNVNVTVQRLKTSRDGYIALSEAQFKRLGFEAASEANRTVSGSPAVLFDYSAEMGGRQLRFLSLAVVLPDRVLLVTCTAPKASFTRYEPEFRRTLDQFSLLPPALPAETTK